MSVFRAILAAVLVLGGDVAIAGQEAGLPEGEAKPIVERSCTACHGLESITTVRLPKETWREIVLEMVARGADLRENEIPLVIDYLAEHFGTKKDVGAGFSRPRRQGDSTRWLSHVLVSSH
jgi:hypothetical protein